MFGTLLAVRGLGALYCRLKALNSGSQTGSQDKSNTMSRRAILVWGSATSSSVYELHHASTSIYIYI